MDGKSLFVWWNCTICSCIDFSNEEEPRRRVEKSDDSSPGSDVDDSPMKRNWQKNYSDSEEEMLQATNKKKLLQYSSDEEKVITKATCKMESESENDGRSDADNDRKMQKERNSSSDSEHLKETGDAESEKDSEEEEERIRKKKFRTFNYKENVGENKMESNRQNLNSSHSEESLGEMEETERDYEGGHVTMSDEEKIKKGSSRSGQQVKDTSGSKRTAYSLIEEDDPTVKKWEEDSRRLEVRSGSSERERSHSSVHESGHEVKLDGKKRETSDSNDETAVQKEASRHVRESSPKYESSSDGESSQKQKHSQMSEGLQGQVDRGSPITYSRKKERNRHTHHELHGDVKHGSSSSEEQLFLRKAKDSELPVSSEDTSDDEPLSKKRKRDQESESDSDDVPLSKKLSLSGTFQSASETEESKTFRNEDRKGREAPKKSDHSSSDSESESDDTDVQQGQKRQKTGNGAEKRRERSSQDPGKHPKIVRMKRYLREAGIRVQNYNTLWEGCKSIPSRVKRMQELLEKKGLKGKPTLASCKKLRKKLEKKQEMSELDVNLIIQSGTGGDKNRDEEEDWGTKKAEKSTDLFPPGTNVWAKWRQGSFEKVARPAVVVHLKDVPSEHQEALKRKAEQPGNLIVSWLGDWSGWYKVVSVGTVRHLTDSARDRRWAGRSTSVHNAFLHALKI